ncbi:hypothetical protein L6164_017735 [Bauhinia variegata]|uniref:Uncharacterized protein n=1 Tax=Bauhinia variegata TaxID=167791 RepID=A0ACB9N908_BAUVA|nr:hypothetical protein L6164_017735 [Bauhinia variegata]
MDFSLSHLSSSLGTMFSPFTESDDDVLCNLFDGVREQIISVPCVNDDDHGDQSNSSPSYQAYHLLDSHIYEMCFSGLSDDRIGVFDDNANNNIFCDRESSGTNLIYDATEGFMMFPFPEETVESTDSHYEGSSEEFQQISDYSWFHHMCQQSKPFSQELEVKPCQFDSDEVNYSDPESFIRNFAELSDEYDSLPALVSKETSKRKRITLVLDLDETLVHSTMEPCEGADFTIQVFFDKKEHTIYVRERPFLQAFLETVSKMFEIIIFTASQRIYAEKVLDVLDSDRKLFSQRVYRESCVFSDGTYTKDLTILGVDLAKVFIIDNSPQVFRLQADNGIPIKSWYDDPHDSALISLLPFLEKLVDVDDVRPIIAKKFGIRG